MTPALPKPDRRPSQPPVVANATSQGSRRMFDSIVTVSIALGSVVLDSPDQTGRFVAKDLAGGWAYLVGDAEGDNRFRGQGACEGGLDTTLRCGFLSAINRIPECQRIRVLVETRQAHQMMVRLARRDPNVVAAIAGRPLSVMTRPEERSSHQVRSAAEHAARVALRDRERATWQSGPAGADHIVTPVAGPQAAETADAHAPGNWRAWRGSRNQAPGVSGRPDERQAVPTPLGHDIGARGFIRPIIERTRDRLVAAGMLAPTAPQRGSAVKAWLLDLDRSVAAVASDLQDAGA